MPLSRRAFIAGAFGMAAGLTAAQLTHLGRSTWDVHTSHHVVALPGLLGPIRVVLATDLHVGPLLPGETLERWMTATQVARPDLILFGGDLVDRHARPSDLARLAAALRKLHAPLGVVGVWGNHDYASALPLHNLERALQSSGVQMLKNRQATPRQDLQIIGLDDLLHGRRDLARAFSEHRTRAATLVLSHNPDVIPSLDARVGLALAGHTHGGQIVLPGGAAPFSSSRYGRRYLAGWVAQGAYVSRGLGVAYLPLRMGAPAELAVFDLHPPK